MANQYDTNLKLQAIADAIGDSSSSGLISALEDIADAVAGGGGGSSAGLVSDNFSETDTYDLGDYCIHNNTLYVCINAINTPGPWDLSDWQATNAGMELSSLNSAISTLNSRRWTFLTAIQANGTYTVPDLSQYKEYQIRAFLTNVRLTLLYDDIANFTMVFPEWTSGNVYVYCKIQKTNNTTLTVSDSTISTMSSGAYFYVYAK